MLPKPVSIKYIGMCAKRGGIRLMCRIICAMWSWLILHLYILLCAYYKFNAYESPTFCHSGGPRSSPLGKKMWQIASRLFPSCFYWSTTSCFEGRSLCYMRKQSSSQAVNFLACHSVTLPERSSIFCGLFCFVSFSFPRILYINHLTTKQNGSKQTLDQPTSLVTFQWDVWFLLVSFQKIFHQIGKISSAECLSDTVNWI